MKAEEFRKLVEDTCYEIDGRFNKPKFNELMIQHINSLPDDEALACYGYFMYRPDKDIRFQHFFEESFKCPDCGMVSCNVNDKKNRYCSVCKIFFSDALR